MMSETRDTTSKMGLRRLGHCPGVKPLPGRTLANPGKRQNGGPGAMDLNVDGVHYDVIRFELKSQNKFHEGGKVSQEQATIAILPN